jgi:serine/threonine protein kinase
MRLQRRRRSDQAERPSGPDTVRDENEAAAASEGQEQAEPVSPYVEEPPGTKPERPSWGLEEGAPIAEGRTVLRALGGGSRFEVFLVWDDRLFAIMVAKLLRPDQANDERALRELRREAETLDRLSHPVLVRGYDAVLDGQHPHILLEHLEGPTLRSLIKRHGPLPLQQLLPLALHVAAAIHYMAAEEMVHLDVKPDNIVMGVPPRLIDLSIARSFKRAARLTGSLGTDPYMAPEQCGTEEWRGRIGPASDVWGLGATLFHSVSGKVPFSRPRSARRDPDPTVRWPQLVAEPRPLPGRVPEPLAELIHATLAKDPDQRPTAAELAMGLEPLVAGLPRRLTFGRRGARSRVF